MRLFGALAFGAVAALATWRFANMATQSLDDQSRGWLLAGVPTVGLVFGFLAGGTIARRGMRDRTNLSKFAALAGGFGGGCTGAAVAVGLTAGYLRAYASWPADVLGQILFVLAIPAFAAVGWFVGAALGSLAGLLEALLLRLTPVRRR
ncbi:MAG: hypothetical protein ACR2GA_02925 [Chloroflexota bacterium]